MDFNGNVLAEFPVDVNLIGDLAIQKDGVVYTVNKKAEVTGYKDSEVVFNFGPVEGYEARSGITFDENGNLYFTLTRANVNYIQKISPEGEGQWLTALDTFSVAKPPEFSYDQRYLFMNDEIYDVSDGHRIEYQLGFQVQYFTGGQNGRNYIVTPGSIVPFAIVDETLQLSQDRLIISSTPSKLIVRPNGDHLVYYSGNIVLFNAEGEAQGEAGSRGFTPNLVDFEKDYTIYTCGRVPTDFRQNPQLFCNALNLYQDEPVWELTMGVSFSETDIEVSDSFLYDHQLVLGIKGGRIFSIYSPADKGESNSEAGPNTPVDTDESVDLIALNNEFSGGIKLFDDRWLIANLTNGNLVVIDIPALTYRLIALPDRPIGTPNFTDTGDILITLRNGNLLKMDLTGNVIWQYTPSLVGIGISGPQIALDGSIYYTIQRSSKGLVIAVDQNGEEKWIVEAETTKIFNSLLLTANGQFLLFLNEVYDARTGARIPFEQADQIRTFFIGQDGKSYYLSDNSIYEVLITPGGVQLTGNGAVTEAGQGISYAGVAAGGVLSDGTIWFRKQSTNQPFFYNPDGTVAVVEDDRQSQVYQPDPVLSYTQLMSDSTYITIDFDRPGTIVFFGPSALGSATLVE
jgi:hypothetical protein